MKIYFKNLLSSIFPFQTQKLIMFIQSLIRKFTGNPNESELVYQILGRNSDSTMIDVGAHTGGSLRPFANNNWYIYAFEPDLKNRKELQLSFKKFPNISVYSEALSDKSKKNVPFYTSELSSGISSLKKFHETHSKANYVNIISLKKFCKDNKISNIDFLKIDTEGFDFFVLKGLDWSLIKPRVILCEFEDRKTLDLGYSYKDMANYLIERDYHVVVSEWYPIKDYGQNHKWRSLKKYPCELNDVDFGHGNLFAFKKKSDFEKLFINIKNYK